MDTDAHTGHESRSAERTADSTHRAPSGFPSGPAACHWDLDWRFRHGTQAVRGRFEPPAPTKRKDRPGFCNLTAEGGAEGHDHNGDADPSEGNHHANDPPQVRDVPLNHFVPEFGQCCLVVGLVGVHALLQHGDLPGEPVNVLLIA